MQEPAPSFVWRSESDAPRPKSLSQVDDRLRAESALQRVQRGEHLLYVGDFHNAKQLLGAMGRRLPQARPSKTPRDAFRAERAARQREHETLSRVVVALDSTYRLTLSRAPDVAETCRGVWGEPPPERTIVPLKTLLGMLGAAEWRRKGVEVAGLKRRLHPHYGVYSPTRTDYVQLLAKVRDIAEKTVFDIGTGTGVLSFLLLERGAASAVGTDVDPRAVACANENAQRLGFERRFEAREADLFPDGQADLVVCNPPWIPEPPKNRIDRAVFDDDSRMLQGFLAGLRDHLRREGQGLLILSDLAVLLGLRDAAWLGAELERNGLEVRFTQETTPQHGRAHDRSDPLHALRAREVTTLYGLAAR